MANPQATLIAIGFTFALATIVAAALSLTVLRPWLRALLSGSPVSAMQIMGMRMRRSPADLLVEALVTLRHQGREDVDLITLEQFYLAQGQRFVDAQDLLLAFNQQRS